MNLISHAKNELDAIGLTENSPDEMNREMRKNILELIEVFGEQWHSGFSAHYAIESFVRLAKYQPLAPLSGDDAEWTNVSDISENEDGYTLYQNKRASNVFKEVREDGSIQAYQFDHYIFQDENGANFTRGKDSRKYITEWPYEPSHEYVKVISSV